MPNRGAGGVSYRYGFNGKETENDVKGIGNEQDYGMRIYDPRLGRFLSVDPYNMKYPWYTPFQFSGGNPISFVDLDGLEEADITEKYLKYSIDMSNAPTSFRSSSGRVVKTSYNLHGYPVNHLYFWEKSIQKYPELLDDLNKGRVLVEGRAPIFTNALKERFKANGISIDGLKLGDLLEHHHINQGRTAIPITASEHDRIPVNKNEAPVKISRNFGRISKLARNAGAVASNASELTSLFTKNPDAWINQFGRKTDIGVVYKQAESSLYYVIVSRIKSDNEATSLFVVYSSYEWDNELGKFVGKGLVGYGEQYDERGGYSRTVVYDLNGSTKSYHEKGRKARNPEEYN